MLVLYRKGQAKWLYSDGVAIFPSFQSFLPDSFQKGCQTLEHVYDEYL